MLCLLTTGIRSLEIEVNLLGHDSNKFMHTLPPILNSIKDFPGFNFIFLLRMCNVASSTYLGILLLDIS